MKIPIGFQTIVSSLNIHTFPHPPKIQPHVRIIPRVCSSPLWKNRKVSRHLSRRRYKSTIGTLVDPSRTLDWSLQLWSDQLVASGMKRRGSHWITGLLATRINRIISFLTLWYWLLSHYCVHYHPFACSHSLFSSCALSRVLSLPKHFRLHPRTNEYRTTKRWT